MSSVVVAAVAAVMPLVSGATRRHRLRRDLELLATARQAGHTGEAIDWLETSTVVQLLRLRDRAALGTFDLRRVIPPRVFLGFLIVYGTFLLVYGLRFVVPGLGAADPSRVVSGLTVIVLSIVFVVVGFFADRLSPVSASPQQLKVEALQMRLDQARRSASGDPEDPVAEIARLERAMRDIQSAGPDRSDE